MSRKKEYNVTFYYHTNVTVTVKANDEEEALERAEIEVGKKKYDAQIVHNVQEDAEPDIEEVDLDPPLRD